MNTDTNERQPEGLLILKGTRKVDNKIIRGIVRREQVNVFNVNKINKSVAAIKTSSALIVYVSCPYTNTLFAISNYSCFFGAKLDSTQTQT